MNGITRCFGNVVLVALVVVSAGISNPRAQAAEGLAAAAAPYVAKELLPRLAKLGGWVRMLGCGGHRDIFAQYEDGTVVSNDFRCYRSLGDALAHYTDQTEGDCDARNVNTGAEVCYGRNRGGGWDMVLRHGRIVRIWR